MASKREREAARRRIERRLQRREQLRARRRRRMQVLGAVTATLVVVGGATAAAITLTGSPAKKHPSAAASVTPTPTATSTAFTGTCTYTRTPTAPHAKFVGLPPTVPTTLHKTELMDIVTNRGPIKVLLQSNKAPCTVNSFAFLASKHYFDHTMCHRLSNSGGVYVLQCGDPSGTGSGGPGYQFGNENTTGAAYLPGTVAMANSGGTDSNGSQFFIVYKDSPLPPNYTVFGHITSGMQVVRRVAAAGNDHAFGSLGGHPKLKVVIERLTVRRA